MKTPTSLINFLILIGVLIVLESILSITGIFLGNLFIKFNIAIIICLFGIIKFDFKVAPYFILITQIIHSVYSFDAWSIESISGLVLLFLFKLVENTFQLNSLIHLLTYSFLMSLMWNVFSSFMLGLKASDFSLVYYTFHNSFLSMALLALVFPFFYFFMNLVWVSDNSRELV